MKKITIYTDGACHPNPNGFGGWGAVIIDGDQEQDIKGGALDVTNNQMEMQACIEGLKYIKEPADVTVYTDSQYLKKGITLWIKGWKKNGWKTKQKKPVKNQKFWQQIDKLDQFHKIEWKWVKGHNGNYGNEKADELATLARKEVMQTNGVVDLRKRASNKNIVRRWEKATNELAKAFVKKYFEPEYHDEFHWVGDIIGGILTINEYFYEVDLIKEAIELDAPWELLDGFYCYSMDCYEKQESKKVNFRNYVRLNGKIPE